ncbi:dCTP deaminase domain-containing protein [Methylovulum miyakonense]|uniref:dCTP deaminase domain-containing protein n=1 Tax=Methylovulum miyakonense TaxID=645578 RepID=UPI00037A1BEC|nr:hypothetical protein [Methylovulum miyakonense]
MKQLTGVRLAEFVSKFVSDPLTPGYSELDIRVGLTIYIYREQEPHRTQRIHRLGEEPWENLYDKATIGPQGFFLKAGEFIVVNSLEDFCIPQNIKGVLNLRSFAAKSGLGQTASLIMKPGWNYGTDNDVQPFRLEINNSLSHHDLHICTGDVIGQVEFYDISEVCDDGK